MLLLALNATLKFAWLGTDELSGDEPFTVYWSQRPLGELFLMLRSENNPPLYFLLIHAWSGLCGSLDPACLRMPSALFSVLTVWPLFLVVRHLSGRGAALVASLLFTLNNHQYLYAHEVRGYALLLLLTVTAAWWMLRPEPRLPRMRVAVLAVILTGFVYTHFFGWLVIALFGAFTLFLPEWRAARKAWVIALVLATVLHLPYAWIFWERASSTLSNGTWLAPRRAEEMWHMVRRWSNEPVVALMLLLPIAVVGSRVRFGHAALRTGLWWLAGPLVGLWLVQLFVPMYVDRYLLFASPGLYLLAGHALTNLVYSERWRWLAPTVAVCAMAFTFSPWKDHGRHPSHVVKAVMTWSGPGSPTYLFPYYYDLTFGYHLDRTLLHAPVPMSEGLRSRGVFPINAQDKVRLEQSAVLVRAGGWWPSAYTTLRKSASTVDSVLADKDVWVYRFQR